MLQPPPWEAAVNSFAWLGSLVAAVAILLWRHAPPSARTYGAFHVVLALLALGANLVPMEDDPARREVIAAVAIGFALAVPPLVALFLTTFPVDRPRFGSLRARVAIVAATIAVVELVYVLTWRAWSGALSAAAYFAWFTIALAPLVWLRDVQRLPAGPVRETALLASAMTFSVVLVDVVYYSPIAYPRPPSAGGFAAWIFSNLTIYVCFLALWLYARARPSLGDVERNRNDRLLALGVALGTGTALWAVAVHYLVSPSRGFLIWELAGSVACVGALMGLAFGVLRYRMFGVEIKVKWAIGRGTVAAAFVTVFFVASEGAQLVFQERWGPVVGLLGAGALVFAIQPLHRLAERVAEAALPGVKPLDRMTAADRAALYLDQAKVAWADGSLSAKDRQILDVARAKLGLSLDETHALEARAVALSRPASSA